MQNWLDAMTRMNKTEELISDMEDIIMENNEAEEKRERKERSRIHVSWI